jgi:hypothetical protein
VVALRAPARCVVGDVNHFGPLQQAEEAEEELAVLYGGCDSTAR